MKSKDEFKPLINNRNAFRRLMSTDNIIIAIVRNAFRRRVSTDYVIMAIDTNA
jgi:hypothetical protein